MQKRKRMWWILIPLVLILSYGIWDSFSQPSIGDIPGKFEEVAFVRNEQNKGGILRVYAVAVGDIEHANYEACADLFPTNDYGSLTKVYFFDKSKPYPTKLSIDAPHFDGSQYEAIMILKRSGSDKK